MRGQKYATERKKDIHVKLRTATCLLDAVKQTQQFNKRSVSTIQHLNITYVRKSIYPPYRNSQYS